MSWKWVVATYFAIMVAAFVPWSGGRAASVNVIGSSSVQPFAEALAEEFHKAHPAYKVDVQGGGSTVGLQATRDGIADLGMCSRSLNKDEAKEFNTVTLALDGLAIVVHPSNPVDNLSVKHVRQIFAGEVTDWRDVGGAPGPIRLVVREESSGTREAFMKLVMGKQRVAPHAMNQDSNGAIKELVKDDRQSIGFVSLGLVTKEIKALRMDGVNATVAEVKAKRYPLVRPFLFVMKGEPGERAQGYINYVLSPEGQRLLAQEGLVPIK